MAVRSLVTGGRTGKGGQRCLKVRWVLGRCMSICITHTFIWMVLGGVVIGGELYMPVYWLNRNRLAAYINGYIVPATSNRQPTRRLRQRSQAGRQLPQQSKKTGSCAVWADAGSFEYQLYGIIQIWCPRHFKPATHEALATASSSRPAVIVEVKQERRMRCYAYVCLWASIVYIHINRMSPPLKTGNPRSACDSVLKPAGNYSNSQRKQVNAPSELMSVPSNINYMALYKYNVPAT